MAIKDTGISGGGVKGHTAPLPDWESRIVGLALVVFCVHEDRL